MDKFEQIIKQAVEGHEVPFDPQAWENLSNELGDSFDQLMKDSTASYEAPYNPAAWDAVNSQLGPAYSAWKWIGGSAAAIAIIAGASYFLDNSETENGQLTNHESSNVVIEGNDANDHIFYVEDIDNTDNSNSNGNVENGTNAVDNNMNLQTIDPDLNNNLHTVDNGNGNENTNGNQEENHVVHQGLNDGNGNTNNSNNQTTNNNGTTTDLVDMKVNCDFSITAKDIQVTEICQGDVCTFIPETVESDLEYVWNFGDGGLSSATIGKHKFKKAGEFTITLKVVNPLNNKTVGTNSETIIVKEMPKTDFSWNQPTKAIPTVSFINQTPDATKVYWNIKGLKSSANEEFDYTFRKAGNYVIGLTATNENGCSGTAEKTIEIENDYNLLAPTAFSPDGNGDNDFFIPEALKLMDVDFTMVIMDKSGKMVYTTQNAYEPWDGRYTEDNKMAENGSSYIWRVVLTNSNGEEEAYQGQVFVIR